MLRKKFSFAFFYRCLFLCKKKCLYIRKFHRIEKFFQSFYLLFLFISFSLYYAFNFLLQVWRNRFLILVYINHLINIS